MEEKLVTIIKKFATTDFMFGNTEDTLIKIDLENIPFLDEKVEIYMDKRGILMQKISGPQAQNSNAPKDYEGNKYITFNHTNSGSRFTETHKELLAKNLETLRRYLDE